MRRHRLAPLLVGLAGALISQAATARDGAAPPVSDEATTETAGEDAGAETTDETTAADTPDATTTDGATSDGATSDGELPPLRIAVYDFTVEDVEPQVARVVQESVVAEIRKLRRVSVISMDEIRAMLDLEAQKQATGCDDDSCLSEIADALGADGIIVGSLVRLGDEHIFGLRRIDQRRAQAVGGVSKRLVADTGEEFLGAVGPAVEEIFPDRPLREGAVRGVADEVLIRMNPPPLPAWVFWTGVGTTVASTAATTLALGTWAFARADYTGYGEQGLASGRPIDGAEVKRKGELLQAAGWTTYALAGATLVLVVATAMTTPFIDWQGYADEDR